MSIKIKRNGDTGEIVLFFFISILKASLLSDKSSDGEQDGGLYQLSLPQFDDSSNRNVIPAYKTTR